MNEYATLHECFEAGRLPRANLSALETREMAQAPGDVRDAAMAILSRACEYLAHVDFCPSMITTGRVRSEQPRAISALPDETAARGPLSSLCMTSAPDMPQRIWREARAMCVTTLIGIARWELSKSFPECSDLLERARVAVLAACKSESLTGSVWFSISRHMTTASARRYLERMLKLLPTCWLVVHPETRIPAFVGPSDAQQKRLQYEAVALANNRPLVFSAPIMIHTAAEPAGAIA